MIMCSRILRQWGVNDSFNDATAWMDHEITLESLWIVCACHECKKKLKTQHMERNTCAQMHTMCNNCVGTLL